MQRSVTSVCLRCRLSIFDSSHPERWLQGASSSRQYMARRFRTGGSTSSKPKPHHEGVHHDRRPGSSKKAWTPKPALTDRPLSHPPKFLPANPTNAPQFFQANVNRWINHPSNYRRLVSFGIPENDIAPLLNAFADSVQQGHLSDGAGVEKYGLNRFTNGAGNADMDVIYSTIFFKWATDKANIQLIEQYGVKLHTISIMRRLTEASSRHFPAEKFPHARKIHRKVIMHVGPTNSGKTHHALRALAASKQGVYAGPLRLLAHEIWERLNKGQIVPLGVDENAIAVQPAQETLFDDTPSKPAVLRDGNPRFSRQCNMVTGEEIKIVSEQATLLSCTVEMLSTFIQYDVAVVDEIQMIGDEQRGFGWTNAVLGLCAKELHLCGEETAVPLVEAMLKDTGDELIINRYERLTPLVVEEKSLDGDWSKVKKGDCIVTFRRSNIFSIQREVEALTGMRCAVVYGKLPPEIRSEQAALFNDPNSGYDVIIGSDAIGMGLNLKIRRVIFHSVSKMTNSGKFEHLNVSAVKQIAGRAGRYGLQGQGAEPGGFTTTLHEADLPFIRETLKIPYTPLSIARVGMGYEEFYDMANALPPGSQTASVINAHIHTSQLSPLYRYMAPTLLEERCHVIDQYAGDLTADERMLFIMSPISWRDDKVVQVTISMMKLYKQDMAVPFIKSLTGTTFIQTLQTMERQMECGKPPWTPAGVLEDLESFHKIIVLYKWLNARNSVAYADIELVDELKVRTERALEWALQGMSLQKAEKQRVNMEQWKARRNEAAIPHEGGSSMRRKAANNLKAGVTA